MVATLVEYRDKVQRAASQTTQKQRFQALIAGAVVVNLVLPVLGVVISYFAGKRALESQAYRHTVNTVSISIMVAQIFIYGFVMAAYVTYAILFR